MNDSLIFVLCFLFFSLVFSAICVNEDYERNKDICYNFKDSSGNLYQARYNQCSNFKNNFSCEIDNKTFYVREYERVTCNN